MNNEEKARELANKYCTWTPHVCEYKNAFLEMAQWKDEQFESKLMQIIILAQQGYTCCATDEMILKQCKEIIKE